MKKTFIVMMGTLVFSSVASMALAAGHGSGGGGGCNAGLSPFALLALAVYAVTSKKSRS
jgi:hypothetical protein